MDKKKESTSYEIEPDLEKELIEIDEEKLPLILSDRLELLEKTNKAYDAAKVQEKKVREKVDKAVKQADLLIKNANNARNKKVKTHGFWKFEWSTKNDEIDALKNNLKEMIDCGIESAEAQKELVEVQSALADSQTSLLKVQETQMAYQRQIADATKFLYGLSAYNMASTQSVLINLEAVLTGASKEKLGEMAQQQLMLALDQLKSQESIVKKIKENRELIDSLDVDLAVQEEKINKNITKNNEQDKRIEYLEKRDSELVSKGNKRDKLIKEGLEHDKKQDLEIAAQAKKDEEHDKLIKEGLERDRKHDEILRNQALKDIEHDKQISDLEKKNYAYKKIIDENSNMISELRDEIKRIQVEKTGKWSTRVLYVILIIALMIAIMHFFI